MKHTYYINDNITHMSLVLLVDKEQSNRKSQKILVLLIGNLII